MSSFLLEFTILALALSKYTLALSKISRSFITTSSGLSTRGAIHFSVLNLREHHVECTGGWESISVFCDTPLHSRALMSVMFLTLTTEEHLTVLTVLLAYLPMHRALLPCITLHSYNVKTKEDTTKHNSHK